MTIAEAVAEIDALKTRLAAKTAELKFVNDLTDDLMRIISSLEGERDDWRTRYEEAAQ